MLVNLVPKMSEGHSQGASGTIISGGNQFIGAVHDDKMVARKCGST